MMGNRNKIGVQFTDKKAGLGPIAGGDSFHQIVVIGIDLLEHVEKAITRNVNSFHTLIES